MKKISIREAYDWLYLGEHVSQTEWDELLLFLQERYMTFVEIGYGKIRWINLVGVIQLSTVRIEILPKIVIDGESEEKNRFALLNMLSITKTLPVTLNDETKSQIAKADLLHVFAHLYIQLLLKELRRGIYKEYKLKQENSKTLKGRFLLSEHIRQNSYHSVNAFCEYDEFQEDVLLNQILKRALMVLFPYISKTAMKVEMMFLMDILKDVSQVAIHQNELDSVSLHRQNNRFEQVLTLAKLILSNGMMTSKYSNRNSFSLLFEMNQLFESYIDVAFRHLSYTNELDVRAQHEEKRLLVNVYSGLENIKLKPDFVLTTASSQLIVDTKWKSIVREGRLTYQQSDLYQMYAYVTSYEHAQKCVLLYPRTEEAQFPKWQVPDTEKFIEINTVRLNTFQDTLEDLEQIL
ncbi:ATP-dependent helicase [Anaerobacillus sp. CMMVII]|uniref:McrC family protein n=1 Tax=Anaerobacillus sp. CMMVII TaxID=2755588 RepID=UPI0021B777DE|nr:McrC family protein [Anaerobacillus sp. CMMVII]MCT8140527.1 ATP-dependent helicase [Anaerobacillus sp. CMMVII]